MHKYFFLIIFSSISVWGNDAVSNKELLAKIELISNRVKQLEQRIQSVEKENNQLRKEIVKSTQTDASKLTDLAQILPSDPDQKKSFLDKLRFEINSNADKASGPWVNPENWKKMRKRMSYYEVRKVLGTPTRIKPSVKPNIEQIYYYSGDLNADGSQEEGTVNFSDKRVVSFESPFG
ncbi:outer membrane protein assembly factor BamE domain-containing protein [Candidatus Seribacter sulfatis]|uniref:outer membrane protein assembly factor BamE domain-containing protein n=1 Tax=Candidatus Seribacter sulfatis TaxID=3381756 RepID=UPI00389A9F77